MLGKLTGLDSDTGYAATVGLRATPASPCHLANTAGDCWGTSLSRVSRCFCLYVHFHLCLGCQEEWSCGRRLGLRWSSQLLCHSTASPHHCCCLHHRDPLVGKQKAAKSLINLMSNLDKLPPDYLFYISKTSGSSCHCEFKSPIFTTDGIWGGQEIKANLGRSSIDSAFWELRKEQILQPVSTFHSLLESEGW